MNLEETYDLTAEDWHRDHNSDSWWQEGTDEFISKLPAGAHVLDVGCGSGVKSKYLMDHGLHSVGIDISNKMLEIAQREAPDGTYHHLSMTALDELPEIFDGVFVQASLLHILKSEASGIVKKLVNRAKPGGLVYIAVKEVREGRPEEAVEKENDYGYDYERFFSYFTMPELERYLADADTKVVWKLRTQHPSGKTVWLQIIAQK